MHKRLLAILLCLCGLSAFAQSDVKYRIILIGDAGEINGGQEESIQTAAKHVIKDKTTTVFLGDNVYPVGFAIPYHGDFAETSKILQSQFKPMRDAGAAVYFVPGNHDWDKSGPNGLAKIIAQGDYLASFNDKQLKMVPANGCPDPVEIKLTDKLTIIAYDSEWWLFPYEKSNPEADCGCHTKDEVIFKMADLLERNKDKMIILASHHPLYSYGSHGGYYTWRNHLLPLTLLNKNLYIPLPVIGSIYPFLRSTFLSPEDLKHPAYQDLAKKINGVFGEKPNVVYAAGHEHGLQFIKGKNLQIVSGAGSKMTPNKQGKLSLFNTMAQGYVVADQLKNNDMRYQYYVYTDTGVNLAYSYTQPYRSAVAILKKELQPVKTDSITVSIKPVYDSVGKFHRYIFGDNYRKDYAVPVKVPVLRISKMKGGLKVTQLGGGNQSKSLRLEDKNGKEYALRSVEKYPEVLLPATLRQTFLREVLVDNMSAQHPYGALVVPILADAVNVAHSNPIIGYVSPDPALEDYQGIFANTLCLFEEREPVGESDNTAKMFKKLDEDNDNRYDAGSLLRARMLDVIIGDWDRHEDQWRWKQEKTKKGDIYSAVPRDRDQAFFSSDGKVQRFAQSSSLLPMMQGYERDVQNINWFLWEGRAMNSRFLSQYTEQEWDAAVKDFCSKLTDQVMEKALKALPEPIYSMRHDQFLAEMKSRREKLPKWMNEYYHFFNRVVDIQTSDKNERVVVTDSVGKHLKIVINKIAKDGDIEQELFSRNFDPAITKEIRLYTKDGKDSVYIDNKTSPIKLRIIAGGGKKVYDVKQNDAKTILYGRSKNNEFLGDDADKMRLRLSADTANTGFVSKDLYSRTSINPNAGYNRDDGLLLGAIVEVTNPGFRKQPFGNKQTFSGLYSFKTSAVRFKYFGQWLKLLGKADLTLRADINAPNNTQNFYGVGNETVFDDKGDNVRYHRTRFNLYQFEGAMRYRRPKSTFSFGPLFQFYRYNKDDNEGRFITNTAALHSFDSLTIARDKFYAGAFVNFSNNTRDNDLLPTLGSFSNFRIDTYKGLNNVSNSFAQFTGDISLFKNLDGRAKLILADRFGGGITIGKPAFYQNLFLGGQSNLLGFRQFRFAGQHSFYNNLELRAKLGDFVSYILPGQVGLIGFYDTGRVWRNNEASNKWHHGVGGGMYFAPASLTVFRFIVGHSTDGWYPYVSMNFRY